MFCSVEEVISKFKQHGFITDRKIATAIFLTVNLNKPLLVEGPAGVGKTELGKVLAKATGTELIRLQCYEGLDESKALYEWNYQKQLLRVQCIKLQDECSWKKVKDDIYTREFLLARPLLKAFTTQKKVTLLIDEIDKSDEEFESFLLEALSEYQVTIPEYGTVKAIEKPIVVLTSNNSRSLSDALKRRCLHLYIDFPNREKEMDIIKLKMPNINNELLEKIADFVQNLRRMELRKAPSISETIDWARSLKVLQAENLEPDIVINTLNVLLKYDSDYKRVYKKLSKIIPSR